MKKMNLATALLCVASLFLCVPLGAASGKYSVNSPDGRIGIRISADKGQFRYAISFDSKTVVQPSCLGFEFSDGAFGPDVKLGKPSTRTVVDEYDLPVGKTSHVRSVSYEMTVPVTDAATGRKVELVVRAFDDAVAFRYVFPEQQGWDKLVIMNETMDVKPFGDPMVTALYIRDGYVNSHEGPYVRIPFSKLEKDVLIDMPTLFEFPGCQMAVMEANLVDYAGMYLVKKDGGKCSARLSPKIGEWKTSVVADLPHRTPWRVFQMADRPGKLIESTVLTTLADPCKVDDLSWLKPGKTTFPWWCDSVAPDTTFQWGNNFQTAKYYIDFAADHGLDYHSVYGYADMPWYIDDGPGFGLAGPNADLTRHDPRLDFPAVCRYAASRGVGIHVWLNWAALYKDIDRVFDKFNEWGVKGMMVDFMNRDDQEMIRIQEDILRKAAEHHLFIQFHGASKPSGLVRTYPNEFTREGTLNYEVYKWDLGRTMGADHDIAMPFTRLLAGPADYHLGGFRSQPMDSWTCTYHAPTVTSTRCHMLGMYIVMESYLAMVCDYPDAYRGQKGFNFLRDIPTNWDDTVVPAAEIAEYCCVARRHGSDWFVGAINNSEARSISVPLDFLPEGRFEAFGCFDSEDTDTNPNNLVERRFPVDRTTVLDIPLGSGGGFAFRLSPAETVVKPLVTFRSLLDEVVDRDALTRFPSPSFKVEQQSSYDRKSVTPGTPGWYANSDFTQFLRTEQVEGRIERVMMEAEGPGAIVRIWTTTGDKRGTMRIYIDSELAVEIPGFDVTRFPLDLDRGFAVKHPLYREEIYWTGGTTLFLPIPYAKSCKVTFEEPLENGVPVIPGEPFRYYHVEYRTYAPGTRVESFNLEKARADASRISSAAVRLLRPENVAKAPFALEDVAVAPGQAVSIDLPAGATAVRELVVKASAPDSLWIEGIFDGERTFDIPFSELSTAGYKCAPMHSWWADCDGAVQMRCRFPMPYRSTASIRLVNKGSEGVCVSAGALVTPYLWTPSSMYFHAAYTERPDLRESNDFTDADEFVMADLKGRGVYVGDVYSVENLTEAWWGEGDEKIWVDGESFPSHFGTGTEDYYNASWGIDPFMSPFGGCSYREDRNGKPWTGWSAMNRTRSLDAIPFTDSLHFVFEQESAFPGTATFNTTIFYYQL